MVGRDGIEPPTPGFSVLWLPEDYRARCDRIGRNTSILDLVPRRFRSIVPIRIR